MTKFEDLTGIKFGRLKVIKLHHIKKIFRKNRNKHENIRYWLCECDCGNKKISDSSNLKRGNTKSCGCLKRENGKKAIIKMQEKTKTHCKSKTRIYKIWQGIKRRCFNKNSLEFNRYGGRGITICQEWLDDFMNFYNWAISNGYNESLSIDRINTNGNYEPNNCRWANPKQQARNTRQNKKITYKGKTMCLSEWSEIINISVSTLSYRLKNNWDVIKAFETPERKITKAKKVKCIETGEIFQSSKYASQKFDIKLSDISACCNGRQKSAHGYHWEYVD